jgi:hypothetical protein
VLVVALVNFTPVQNFLARRAAIMLSAKLKTKVEIAHVRIDFLNHLSLQGLYVEDQAHDTLVYAGDAEVRISDWFIFKDKPVLHYLSLHNTYAHLYRAANSKDWNYRFIEDAFSTGSKKSGKPFKFDLEKLELHNVRFHMDDKWLGEDLAFDVGAMVINANSLDFDKKMLDVKTIDGKNTDIYVDEYMGGRPKSMRPPKVDTFDKTPFNPGKWGVKVHNLDFANFTFHLKMNDKVPEPGLFDENHIDITKITAKVNNINIVGDTVHGDVMHLNAHERCGIAIKEMRSKVTVSPNASICDRLYLETNHSKIKDYYAMHYRHFPDFLEYIDRVVMVGHVNNSIVDKRDIAYFGKELKNFPETVLQVSGDGKGTVANLSGYNMSVSDGNVAFKGNVTMKGLPDIYKTYITCTNSEILSTGSGILHYAPQLRNSPDVALEKITYAFFKGDYHGYIENFAVNGTLKTNLGSVTSNVKLDIPGFKGSTAVYSGTVSSDRLNIGMLFRQPLFGELTMKETIAGNSFHPDLVQLNMDGVIDAFAVNDYTYRNIHTKGTLAKKQFNGSVLVDDPNLALEFDGGINYSAKALQINATAHLLGSNFKALNLTKDTVTLSGDFDLNCTGSNIDNFLGYAKLFNIDLKRNARRLAVDSVYVNSSEAEGVKTLTVQSNDLVASVRGTYELSKLPPSFQYYLSRYMPNYIKQPSKYAPDQNFEFTVTTGLVDSIFAVTYPLIRGFDNSRLSGSLNTQTQRLALNVQVPYGIIGNVHLNDISVTATGDLNGLAVSSSVENVVIGDSMLNGSLSLTATVSNDSANFNLGTTARSINSSLSLNGQILARRDTLLLTLQPSQFYLNNNTWNVAGGSSVVYSDKYLAVHGISLASGLQRITASSDDMAEGNPIIINAANIDLAQLSAWAGLADYQPDGRINGTIKLEKIFTGFQLDANVKATNMMLGADTVGTINLIGSYNAPRKLVYLDPQTGIYRDNASIVASGNISFDTLTDQMLDGRIQFNDAPVAWANPFLNVFLSHVAGTVNGAIDFSGSSAEPQIKGTLGLKNAAMKVDYLGCNYTIPTATITVSNDRIGFGKTQIFDRYNNIAILSGYFSHNHFKDMKMRVSISSSKFETVNLTSKENDMFYGHLIASMDSFTIRGPFDNIRLRAYNASAAAKSHIYIPVTSAGEVGTYSYVTFKTYGAEQTNVRKKRDKLNINIEANLNDLVEMTIIPDPAAGDEITATGEGNIQMDIPANNDIRVNGIYTINKGTYTYTFPQLKFITRQFNLNPGSTIRFNGPFMETSLDVDATYTTTGRLYDLLTPEDKNVIKENATDLSDAKLKQTINVLLHMKGTLEKLQLTFDLDLPEKHSTGTYAYTKLMRINQDDKQKFEQVGALLLVGNFIPPDGGVAGGTATSGALTNFSQILSTTASTGLTNIVNKLTGDNKINIDINYLNYNYADPNSVGGINRNQISGTIRRNYLNDKLIVEVGGTSDWGRPASASTSTNFNITGDFRVQYLLSQPNGMRLNAFRNSNYDVTLDRSIVRSGMGISWRKSFDNLPDFLHGKAYAKKKREELDKALHKGDSTNKEGMIDLN